MADLSGKLGTVSLLLSHILDEAGVTERVVKKIQHTGLKREKIRNIMLHLIDSNKTAHFFGSNIEGTSTRELKPDHDELWCLDNVHVEQDDNARITDGKINYLIHQGGNIPAGYCRLELLSGSLRYDNRCQWKDQLCQNGDSVYVKNTLFAREFNIPESVAHGPAVMLNCSDRFASTDCVFAFKCHSISKQMISFIDRMRSKTFTKQNVIYTAEKSGFFLVPVGHRLSKDEDRELEWRVSPSLTERCLMFGMNIAQIKCYVILKMLKRDIIAPQVGDCISSYHLKTVLFHCVENTPKCLWTEKNLLLCVNMCIYHLLVCVEKTCCQNYLLPDENLFLGKIRNEQYSLLEHILRTFMNSNGQYLFAIRCNNIGQKLRERIQELHGDRVIKNKEVYVDLQEEQIRLGICGHKIIRSIRSCFYDLLGPQHIVDLSYYVKWIEYLIDKLHVHVLLNTGDVDTLSTAVFYLKFMFSTYGSLLGCLCIRDGKPVSTNATSFLERGYDSDISSGRLKAAAVFISNKRYDKAVKALEDLDQQWSESYVANVCNCLTSTDVGRTSKSDRYLTLHYQYIAGCSSESEMLKLMACDVMFTIHEVHVCPPELIFELFRDVGDDRKRRLPTDRWMDFAVVDSIIFLNFLMYTVYGKLGNRNLQILTLLRLERIVTQRSEHTNHTETAYNLLGQCFETEEWFDDALSCYRQSLKIRRRNNAAMWLVTLFVYKQFCRRVNTVMYEVNDCDV